MTSFMLAPCAALLVLCASVAAAAPPRPETSDARIHEALATCPALEPLLRQTKRPTIQRIGFYRELELFHVVVSPIKRWIVRLAPDADPPCMALPIGATKLTVNGDFMKDVPGVEKAYFFSGAEKAESAEGYAAYGAVRAKADARPLAALVTDGVLLAVDAARILPDEDSLVLRWAGWGGAAYSERISILHVVDGGFVELAGASLGVRDEADRAMEGLDDGDCLTEPLGRLEVRKAGEGEVRIWEQPDDGGERRYELWDWRYDAARRSLERTTKLAERVVPLSYRCGRAPPRLTP